MSHKICKPQFDVLVEDSVQCLFFFTSLSNTYACWEQRCSEINNYIGKIAENYIWHKDKLRLYVPICDNRNDLPPHLASNTCFGDNIEDEWFIVYIVLELTKQYDDMIVQMTDNDGEFLLIEAANLLPSWVNPENTDNRVFIANNHIHLIEPDVVNLDKKLKLKDAIKIVLNRQTFISSAIDQAILSKINNYPEKIHNNIHRAVVNLPAPIATLLSLNPELIAPIVCAYCEHDMIDAKACHNISFDNCVTIEVKFTKFLYAILAHSKLLKYNKHKFISEKDKKNMIAYKLACGFQMILNSSNDIFSTKEYKTFISSLKNNGYFKNNIEGSKEYITLLEKAKSFFTNVECPMNLYVSNQITQIMSTKEYANKIEKIQMNNYSIEELIEDDDNWLNLQPDQLNDFLNSNYGKKTKLKNNDVISSEEITSELSNFLANSSDFEGIEIRNGENNDKHVEFNAEEFTKCLDKIMNLLTTETENSDNSSESNDFDEVDEDMDLENNCENDFDIELKMKLNCDDILCSKNSVSDNIKQSIREEKASSGPSSNLLKAIGMNKSDVLDFDDDNN